MVNKISQINLFSEVEPEKISIEASASMIGVSTATIRNWIKTDCLKSSGRGKVSLDSLNRFTHEIGGTEKLNQRANKSLKDNHDHAHLTAHFMDMLDDQCNLDVIGSDYEKSLSDSHRNKEGIYYTPQSVVDSLLTINIPNVQEKTFCDPCCGSGNFVMKAISLGFKPENIFAYDIDPVAVKLTQKRIFARTGFNSPTVIQADFLDTATATCSRKYDYIFTNPPWGKKIDKKERQKIGKLLGAGSSINTCSLFFFLCIKLLNEGGKVGLLLPEAFFNIASFEDARLHALQCGIEKIIDFGKPFSGLLTKAYAIVIDNKIRQHTTHITCEAGNLKSKRSIASFNSNPKSVFNIPCSEADADVLSYIFSIPYVTLKNNAQWGLGIVTGNNKKFIKEKPDDNLLPVYKGSDITSDGLKPPSSFIPQDFAQYQQVAPIELYQANQKIIYKFISSKLCLFYDSKQRFVLNSINFFIPTSDFPVKMEVLCDLFSSNFMNWIFRNIFNTHKILRSDLEVLPIHSQFINRTRFDELEYIHNLGIERRGYGTYRLKR